MKRKVKIVDEDTLELREVEVEVEDEIVREEIDNFASELRQALGCESEEFYEKYKAYKNAEKEFNDLYIPFKTQLIGMYKDRPDLPKNIIIGGAKLTYVSPSTRNMIDSKKLKEEEPKLAKKYTKTSSVSATLRIEDSL